MLHNISRIDIAIDREREIFPMLFKNVWIGLWCPCISLTFHHNYTYVGYMKTSRQIYPGCGKRNALILPGGWLAACLLHANCSMLIFDRKISYWSNSLATFHLLRSLPSYTSLNTQVNQRDKSVYLLFFRLSRNASAIGWIWLTHLLSGWSLGMRSGSRRTVRKQSRSKRILRQPRWELLMQPPRGPEPKPPFSQHWKTCQVMGSCHREKAVKMAYENFSPAGGQNFLAWGCEITRQNRGKLYNKPVHA